ncbi:hypothetical protein ACSBR1_039628 [Camellia fascicularis]
MQISMSPSNVDHPLRLIQPPASATSTCHSGVASKGNDLKPIDRLTEMPDDILSFILSFLSIRDSVKARILSRRWRYICPFILNLDFDLHTVLGINYKARYSNGDSDISCEDKMHIRFMVAYERGTQYMFNGIANDLPRLQTLSLVLTTDEVLPIPARITRFNSLKQLELFVMVSSDFNLLSLTSLLNASPLLQKLHLSLHTGRSRGRRIEQQYSKHVHCELKEVEVHGFLGRWNEMELAIYLLKNAVSLERMILSTQKRLYHGGGKWTSSRCPWFEWHRKKACAYDLLQKEKVNSHTELLFL